MTPHPRSTSHPHLHPHQVLLNDAAGNTCAHGGEPLRVTISPRAAQHGDYGEVLSVTDQPDGSFLLPSASASASVSASPSPLAPNSTPTLTPTLTR